MKSSLVAGTEGAVTQGLTEIDTSAWGDLPREQVEVMTRTTGATQLWWETVIDGVASGWSELQGNGQLVGLVKSLAAAGDKLVIEDDSPVTRYAQIMLIDEGILHVELASLQPEGTYNWRIGMGRDADDAVNTPDTGTAAVQELTIAATIEVLSSWAAGHGLPGGYGAALHIYGG